MKPKQSSRKNFFISSVHTNTNGIILVVALALIAVLGLAATISVNATHTDLKISSNYKSSVESFYIAESGVQHAKGSLSFTTFDNVLDGTFGSSPGVLNFGTNTSFAGGTYTVLVFDDNDGDGDLVADFNDIVIVTGTGTSPNGSGSSVQIVVSQTPAVPLLSVPGAITVVGEANTAINGNAVNVDGRDWMIDDIAGPTGSEEDKYAVALSSIGTGNQSPNQSLNALNADINTQQDQNFVGTNTAFVESIGLDTSFTSETLQEFVDGAKKYTDNSLMISDLSPQGQAISGNTSGPNNEVNIEGVLYELGSVADPKVTYFNMKSEDNNGDDRQVSFTGDITGAGLLIIEGNDLLIKGNLDWTGIVIVIGDDVGGGLFGGGSNGNDIRGAFIVDEQDTDNGNEVVLSGNVNVRYSSEALTSAQKALVFNGGNTINILSWSNDSKEFLGNGDTYQM